MRVALRILMIRLLIATYIVLVLVLSAKAKACEANGSDFDSKKLNNQMETSEKLNIQDPLPDFDSKSFHSIRFTENFVG